MSQFYDQASLVMVPSGYKAGKVYSQKPLSTDGELTFTRNSNATRVNADGLVEKVRTNQFTYSNDFSNGIWAKSNLTVAQVGDAWEVTDNTTSGSHYIYSGITIFPNTQYSVSITAKAGSVDYIAFRLGGFVYAFFNLSTGTLGSVNAAFTNATIESVGNGYYRCTATATTAASGNAIVFYPSDNGTAVAYTGTDSVAITIKDAQAEFSEVATDYIPTTSAAVSVGPTANVPRLNYSNGCPSLLLEPQRTNLTLFSESLNTSPNVADYSTVTPNAYISPDGYQNADQFTETTSNGRHGFYQYVALSSAAYTASIFTKQTGRRYISFQSDASGPNSYSFFDLETKSVVSAGTGYTCSVEDYGNGWLRLIATVTAVAGSRYFIWGGSPNGTNNTYVGDTSISQTFWGAQLEAGSYATSYIPTLGASVTRLVDGLGTLNMATLCPTSNYSIFFEIDDSNLTDPSTWLFLASSSGSGDPFQIYASTAIINTASGYIYPFSYVPSSNASGKVCLTYNGTTVKVFKDGVLVGQYTANANWANKTTLNFTHNPTQKNNIKQILLFPSVLTEAQAIELTTV